MNKWINPELIKFDLSVYARARINEEVVTEYTERIKQNDNFPPILLYWNGRKEEYFLADGYHRFLAYQAIEPKAYIFSRLLMGRSPIA